MRYITMRRRDTEQIVRRSSINSNEVIRRCTWIRLKVTLIALLTNRPTPPLSDQMYEVNDEGCIRERHIDH